MERKIEKLLMLAADMQSDFLYDDELSKTINKYNTSSGELSEDDLSHVSAAGDIPDPNIFKNK